MSLLVRTVGWFELVVAVLSTWVLFGAATEMINPPPPPRGEWTGVVAVVCFPLAISFPWAALALLRSWRKAWLYQVLPFAVLAALAGLFWWLDQRAA